MKKLITMVLEAVMVFSMLAGCGEKTPETVSEVVNVAALNGPTGMAMVQLMDMEDKYNITTYQAPTDVTAKVINGEVDVAAVPSNLAAVLYNKTKGEIVAISPIALGMLQIIGNDVDLKNVSDLKGKTIVASGQGGTPEYILRKILEENNLIIYEDVKVEWLANHSEVNSKLLSQKGMIAMVPEPFASSAIAAGEEGNVKQLFDLNNLWEEFVGEELPMGVLIASKSFVQERGDDLKVLLSDLGKSVEFINDSPEEAAKTIVEKGFIGNVDIAESAIPGCNIVLYQDKNLEAGKNMLKTFYETLFEMDPASVGGTIPDENLYYSEK